MRLRALGSGLLRATARSTPAKSAGRRSRENLQELCPDIQDEVYSTFDEATLRIERNPDVVQSITSFPSIADLISKWH
jgi:hypothetical protein